MLNHRITIGLMGVLVLGVQFLPAQETAFHFDPAQTTVAYSVASTVHTVHGTFALKRGEVRLDASTGKASGELVVDAASGNSGSNSRDSRMKNTVLESAAYPEIVFRPDRVSGKLAPEGESQVEVHGMFVIHGTGHPIDLPAQVRMTSGEAAVTLKFVIPYVDWGMKNPGNFLLKVKNTVDLEVRATASIVTPPRT